jgi:hypothetical protein
MDNEDTTLVSRFVPAAGNEPVKSASAGLKFGTTHVGIYMPGSRLPMRFRFLKLSHLRNIFRFPRNNALSLYVKEHIVSGSKFFRLKARRSDFFDVL